MIPSTKIIRYIEAFQSLKQENYTYPCTILNYSITAEETQNFLRLILQQQPN
jgi:hypothetical protein